MKRRIIEGIGANSFGMAITIAIQLVSLPLFLHFWNLETYGKWLILSAIPSYLSMADVGMVSAAGNKMTMAMGRNNPFEANQIFQSSQAFMLIICVALALIVIPIALFAPLPWFESMDQRIALAVMSLGILVGLFGGLSEAAFRASERYAFGTMLANYSRLGEWLGSLLGLALIGNFAAVSLGGFIMKLIGCIVGMILVNKNNLTLNWGLRYACLVEIKSMFKPAVSFMAFPLANALNFQGITLLVGAMFGPVTLALFSTYRTIARVSVQITAIWSHALAPEFSRLFGKGSKKEINALFLRTNLLGTFQAVLLSLAIYFISPWLLKIWTHDAVHFDSGLMLFMMIYAALCGVWHISRALLSACNHNSDIAGWAIFSCIASISLSWGLGTFYGLIGVVLAMGLSELMIAVICYYLANQFIMDDERLMQDIK